MSSTPATGTTDDNALFLQALQAKGLTPKSGTPAPTPPASDNDLFMQALQAKGLTPKTAPQSPPVSLSDSPGTPLTPADRQTGLRSLGEVAPGVSDAPLVPMAPPPDSDAAYRQQIGALHDDQAAFNAKLKAGKVTTGDVQAITDRDNQFLEWAGQNGHGDRPEVRQFIADNRGRGYNVADPPKPGQGGGYLSDVLLPDAEAAGKGLLQTLGGLGQFLNTSGGYDPQTVKDRAQAVQSLDPRNLPNAPGIGPLVTMAGGALQYLNPSGGYSASPSLQVAGGAKQFVADAESHPVQTTLNVLPFALHGLHGYASDLGETVGNLKARAAALDAAPPLDQGPAPPLNIPPVWAGALTDPNIERAINPAVHPLDAAGVPRDPMPAARASAAAHVAQMQAHGLPVMASDLQSGLKTLHGLDDRQAGDVAYEAMNPPAPLHPTAPGANGAARAVDGKFTPAPEPTTTQEAPDVPQQAAQPRGTEAPQGAQVSEAIPRNQPPAPAPTAVRDVPPAVNVSGPEVEQPLPAQPASASPVAAEASPVTVAAVKKAPPEYANSINLRTLDASPEVTQRTRQNVGDNPIAPTTIPEITAKSIALGLQPEQLKALAPGQVPAGLDMPTFLQAVRSLGKSLGQKSVDASDAHAADPTPANLQAVVDADQAHRNVLQHQQALATQFGQTGAVLASDTSAFQAVREGALGKQQALGQVPKLSDLSQPAMKVTTRAGGKKLLDGSTNTRTTIADRDAALSALTAKLKGVHADPLLGLGTIANALPELTTLGKFYIEAGARDFASFSKALAQHVTLTPGQAQQVYANARAETARDITNQQKPVVAATLANQLTPRMGRQGVADFTNDLGDRNPEILDKLARGLPVSQFTPSEQRVIAQVHDAHLLPKAKPAPSAGAIQTVNQIMADVRRPAMRAAFKARMQAMAKSRPGVNGPPDPLLQTVKGRVGAANAPEFMRRLNTAPELSGVGAKIRTGQELTPDESLALARNLTELQKPKAAAGPSPVSRQITQTLQDAKAGRFGYSDAKTAAKAELLPRIDQARVPDMTRDIEAVKDGDFKGLADVYNRYHNESQGRMGVAADKMRSYQQNSLLSGLKTLGKIVLTHGLSVADEVTGVQALAQAFNPELVKGVNAASSKYVTEAMRRAIPEARLHLTEGATAADLRGIQPGYKPEGSEITREPLRTPALNVPMRTHGAVYHILGEGLEAHGRYEAASLKAQKSGGTVESHLGDRDVIEAGHRYRQEQMFQNPNAAAKVVSDAANSHPAAGVVVNAEAPFRRIPLNIAGRSLESSGPGLPLGVARDLHLKATGTDFMTLKKVLGQWKPSDLTAEQRATVERNIAFQKARGTLGLAKVAGGAGLAAAGILNAPDPKQHEYGSVNVGKSKIGISELGNVAAPWEVGGEIYNMAKGKGNNLIAPFLDNPLFRASEGVAPLLSGEKGGLGKAAGNVVGQMIPSGLSQYAASFDPSGQTRKQTDDSNARAFFNALRNRVPGPAGRYGLKPSGHPQPSNAASTGLLSVVSPLPIEPRTAEATGGKNRSSVYKPPHYRP